MLGCYAETTFSDSNLVNRTTYYYCVTALVDDEEQSPILLNWSRFGFAQYHLFGSFEDCKLSAGELAKVQSGRRNGGLEQPRQLAVPTWPDRCWRHWAGPPNARSKVRIATPGIPVEAILMIGGYHSSNCRRWIWRFPALDSRLHFINYIRLTVDCCVCQPRGILPQLHHDCCWSWHSGRDRCSAIAADWRKWWFKHRW